MPAKRYVLTARAEQDLREARAWSLARWGSELTKRYFKELHVAAQFIAEHRSSTPVRDELTAGTGLRIYSVLEHYLVYEPIDADRVAIVAVIRQGRDIPAILRKWGFELRRELDEIRSLASTGELAAPPGRRAKGRAMKRSVSRKGGKGK